MGKLPDDADVGTETLFNVGSETLFDVGSESFFKVGSVLPQLVAQPAALAALSALSRTDLLPELSMELAAKTASLARKLRCRSAALLVCTSYSGSGCTAFHRLRCVHFHVVSLFLYLQLGRMN